MTDELGTNYLRIEREGPIAWLTIDRPEARNAFTPAMYFGIKRAVHLVNDDPELRALIITGTGDVFAPGGDLGGRSGDAETPIPPGLAMHEVVPFLTVRDSVAPVISAVNGICQGGGLLIAMLSDIAVCSDQASFRAPELLRGITDATYAAVLPAHVGIANARDLLVSGRRLSADEAARMGLISRVVPHAELRERALEAAWEVLHTAPEARMHVKRMLHERYGTIDYTTMAYTLSHATEQREGMLAFMEKRPPSWVPPTAV